METDAFLILVLSVYVVPLVGAWVLLIGLARYLLLVATALWPWLRRPVPARRWAKVVAAVQGVALVWSPPTCCRPRGPRRCCWSRSALLVESFGRRSSRCGATAARPGPALAAGPPGARRRRTGPGLARARAAAAPRPGHRRRAARDPGGAAGLPGARPRAAVGLGPRDGGRRRGAAGRRRRRSRARPRLLRGVRPPLQPADRPGYLGSGLDLLRSSLGRGGGIVAAGRDPARAAAGAAAVRLGGAAHPAHGPRGAAGVGSGRRRARPGLGGGRHRRYPDQWGPRRGRARCRAGDRPGRPGARRDRRPCRLRAAT